MSTKEFRTLEILKWYQDQHRILRDRCDSLTIRVRVAEAETEALRQKLEEEWQAGWNAAREEME